MAEQFVDRQGEGKEGGKEDGQISSGTPLKTILQSAQEERDGKEGGSPPNTILRARREGAPAKSTQHDVSPLFPIFFFSF